MIAVGIVTAALPIWRELAAIAERPGGWILPLLALVALGLLFRLMLDAAASGLDARAPATREQEPRPQPTCRCDATTDDAAGLGIDLEATLLDGPSWADIERLALTDPIVHAAIYRVRCGMSHEQALMIATVGLCEIVRLQGERIVELISGAPASTFRKG
jgi:hypothetical protein